MTAIGTEDSKSPDPQIPDRQIPDRQIDVIGMRCPLPVLRAGKALRAMSPGMVLEIRASDPMTALDLPNFCRETGHELLSCEETDGGTLIFRIRRGPAPL